MSWRFNRRDMKVAPRYVRLRRRADYKALIFMNPRGRNLELKRGFARTKPLEIERSNDRSKEAVAAPKKRRRRPAS
jgi:hypothetical protein